MASAMMTSATAVAPSTVFSGPRSSAATHQLRAFGLPQLSVRHRVGYNSGLSVRAAQQQQEKASFPLGNKVEITEDAVKKNEQEEPLRVFDNAPVGQFARPESERRPEFGNTDVASVMKFDGPAPETINGRLAMVGIVWAFVSEINSGKGVAEQVVGGGGLLFFLAVVPVIIWASLVPIFGWNESPDSRSFGPFNARAERWNGRAAMIGFASLLVTENLILHGPLFQWFN